MRQPGLLQLRSTMFASQTNCDGIYNKSPRDTHFHNFTLSTRFLGIELLKTMTVFADQERIACSTLKPILVKGQMVPFISFYCCHLSFYWCVYAKGNAPYPCNQPLCYKYFIKEPVLTRVKRKV